MDISSKEKQENEKDSHGFVPRAKLELDKYFVVIVVIWGYSWLIPGILLYYYYKLLIFPDLAIYVQITPIFSHWKYFVIFIGSPLIIILLYMLRLFLVVLLSKMSIWICNQRSPMKELIAAKGIGKQEARDVNYYHLRGMILRILKWETSKSLFPWIVPWAFNFVGINKIGKGTTLEDQFYAQEYLETGENAYIGQGSIISSHLVEGKYGAITLKKVYIGKHTTIGPFNPIPPGASVGDYAEFLPMSGVAKFQKIRGYAKYFGLPVSRISTKRYFKLLQIPKDLEENIYKTKKLKKKKRMEKTEYVK